MRALKTVAVGLAMVLLRCASAPQVVMAAKVPKPTLVLRSTRMLALPGQPIYLTAELVGGGEVDAYYCPTVVWRWADGTESSQGGDCAPFEARTEYPRLWRRGVVLTMPGMYHIEVRLERAERVVARASIDLQAMGGE